MAAAVGHHIDTILKVAKILDVTGRHCMPVNTDKIREKRERRGK